MKILLIFLLIASSAFSQKTKDPYGDKLPMKDGKVFYGYVDTFPDQSKSELFNKVALWASGAFRNSQEANQLVDPDNGEYVAKGSVYEDGMLEDVRTFFTLRISVKDSKCRVQIYNVEVASSIFPNAQPDPAEKITSKKWIRKLNSKMDDVAYNVFQALKKEKAADNF